MAYLKCLRNVSASSRPDGKTVTPTDDISIWLACGGRSEAYTTLTEVLNDAVCLAALINDNNAIDYLVRSTTWASGITADSSAMDDIGNNNYASNTLLDDSTWCSAICNSAYFESVLNVKVPTLNADNGKIILKPASTSFNADYYKAFDELTDYAQGVADCSIGYDFESSITFVMAVLTTGYYSYYSAMMLKDYKIQGSDDNSTYTDITSGSFVNSASEPTSQKKIFNAKYRYMVVNAINSNRTNNSVWFTGVQFYGRADI